MPGAWQFSFLGYKARVLHPEYLLLAAAVLICSALFLIAWARRVRQVRRAVPKRLFDQVLPGYSPARQVTRMGFVLLGTLLFATSMTQPQCGTGTELSRKVGIDVVVALDVSKSMLARDVKPSRLARARLELTDLIDRLEGDRFGLVVFAGTSFVQCPLTTDHNAAKLFLRAVDPDAMPRQGTDLARALRMSKELLTSREGARSRVVVLLTDGEDHSPDALDAADELAADGVKVFAVGIGSSAGEPIPIFSKHGDVVGYKKDRAGNTILSRLDESGLEAIAERTGGIYVSGGVLGAGISEVIEAIDELEKTEFDARMTTRFEDRSALLMYPGFLLLLLGTLLREGRVRRGPRAVMAMLVLIAPALMGMRLFESENETVARGNEAYATEDYERALAAYDDALDQLTDPGARAKIEYNRGTTLAAGGDLDAAKEAFQAALSGLDDGLKARDYYNLGTALLGAGDPKNAVRALVRSLQLDPNDVSAKYNLELALWQLQKPEDDGQDPDEKEDQDQEQSDEGKKEQDQQEQEEQQESGEPSEEEKEGDDGEGSQEDQPDEQQAKSKPGDDEGEQEEEPQRADAAQQDDSEQGGEQEGEKEEQEQQQADAPQQGADDREQREQEREQARAGEQGEEQEVTEVGEQEAEEILDALARREKPLQMQIFMLKDYDPDKKAAPGRLEKDW